MIATHSAAGSRIGLEDQPVERQGQRRIGVEQEDRDAGVERVQAFPETQRLPGPERRPDQSNPPSATAQRRAEIVARHRRDRGQRNQRQTIAPDQHRRCADPGLEELQGDNRHEAHHHAAADRGERRPPPLRSLCGYLGKRGSLPGRDHSMGSREQLPRPL
jgi:hypothetical protein